MLLAFRALFTQENNIKIYHKMRDLILNDVSRCNDYKCPTGAFCARFRQLRFDNEKGIKTMPVTDFKGCEKEGLCNYFLNADILAVE